MIMIQVAEYLGGIGFLRRGAEIAFYSPKTGLLQIPYTAYQAYNKNRTPCSCTTIDIPVRDILFIMEEVNKFILAREKNDQCD